MFYQRYEQELRHASRRCCGEKIGRRKIVSRDGEVLTPSRPVVAAVAEAERRGERVSSSVELLLHRCYAAVRQVRVAV